jgi:coiled-coil domain-containing protein 12
VIKFRNYTPKDEELRSKKLPPQADLVQNIQKRFEQLSVVQDEEALLSLAPQKPNWDLKRDISKKMNRLDTLTKRAVADLIREKLNSAPAN